MKHLIIVKWKEPLKMKDRIEDIRGIFEGCLGIDGVHGVNVFPSCSDRANRHDLMIEIDMEPQALPAYDACEPHHKWKSDYSEYIAHKAIFDYM